MTTSKSNCECPTPPPLGIKCGTCGEYRAAPPFATEYERQVREYIARAEAEPDIAKVKGSRP